jgi:hypothetical protein
MFAWYLASFILHSKWGNENGFSLFVKHAANLYSKNEEDSPVFIQITTHFESIGPKANLASIVIILIILRQAC